VRVDAHCHATQERWHPENWWRAVAEEAANLLEIPTDGLRESVVPAYFDEDGSGQLGSMETAGIDVAVMFHYDWSLEPSLGRPEAGWREVNDWYADLAARSGGRVRWGFGVDPRHEGALEAFEEAVRDRDAVCLKLHPGGGFALNDPAVYPFLDRAGQLGVPVVLHVGPLPPPLESRFAEPALFDTVAGDFPDLPMQAAHTGNEAWREVIEIAVRRPNVFCDLSGWQLRSAQDADRFRSDVRTVLDAVGRDRVMWGTDAPYFRPAVPDTEWVRAFAEAPEGTFTGEEVGAILGGTAARFFRLG
jgi:predicted TIM-barrel fold metal-dependent hydrolase